MRHGASLRGTVPVADMGWDPDDITGGDGLNRITFLLYPAAAGYDEKRLAERMRVPGSAAPAVNETVAPPIRAGASLL